MPHIIVEYSREVESQIDIAKLLKNLHEKLGASESIDPARVKTRGLPLDHVFVGIERTPMIHITLRLMPRDVALMKKIALSLQSVAKIQVPHASVTAEVVVLDPDTYCL